MHERATARRAELRIALLADTHANAAAFETVLDDLARQRHDLVLVLGDSVLKLGLPGPTLALLATLPHRRVYGNMEWAILELGTPLWPKSWGEQSGPVKSFKAIDAALALRAAGREYFAVQPATLSIETPLGEMIACHGSPESCLGELHPAPPPENPHAPFTQDDAAFASALGWGKRAPLVVAGHTHVPIARRIGSTLVVNPGSVGWARANVADRYCTHYAILTIGRQREPRIDWRALPYDNQAAVRAFREKQAAVEAELTSDRELALSRRWHDYIADQIAPAP